MNEATLLPINAIVRGTGGEPTIAGREISVRQIAATRLWEGLSISQLAALFDLTRAQVHAALAYYYEHEEEFGLDGQTPDKAEANREMTATEVASHFAISSQAVREAASKGWIPARKSGATWLIRQGDAEARWGGKSS